MRRVLIVLITFLPVGLLQAQAPSVLDAIHLLDPHLQLSLVYHPSSSECLSNTYSWFCRSTNYNGEARSLGIDAAGNHYSLTWSLVLQETNQDTYYYLLQRLDSAGVVTNLAYFYVYRCRNGVPCTYQDAFEYRALPLIDLTGGRILIGVRAIYPGTGEEDSGVLAISGLPQLFDTLLTFIPGQSALNTLTPAMPDGFRSADSLQVWTGNVRSMPDWSQAQPLACMAAQHPTPGQIVSVADTLPDPAVGEGRYYLVASQSGADRRLGRQYLNGSFSARLPAGLPGCQ